MTDALWAVGFMAILGVGVWARFRRPKIAQMTGDVFGWVFVAILALIVITTVVWSIFA